MANPTCGCGEPLNDIGACPVHDDTPERKAKAWQEYLDGDFVFFDETPDPIFRSPETSPDNCYGARIAPEYDLDERNDADDLIDLLDESTWLTGRDVA